MFCHQAEYVIWGRRTSPGPTRRPQITSAAKTKTKIEAKTILGRDSMATNHLIIKPATSSPILELGRQNLLHVSLVQTTEVEFSPDLVR